MTVQAPIPTVGLFPVKVAVVPQTSCVAPTVAVVGVPFTVTVTELAEGVQGALAIVQVKV
jgi:hypothetical protein